MPPVFGKTPFSPAHATTTTPHSYLTANDSLPPNRGMYPRDPPSYCQPRKVREKAFNFRDQERRRSVRTKAKMEAPSGTRARAHPASSQYRQASPPTMTHEQERHRLSNARVKKAQEFPKAETARVQPSEGPARPSSPFKRGLDFIVENLMPNWGLPEGKVPSGSFSDVPGAYPGSPAALDHSSSQSFLDVSDNDSPGAAFDCSVNPSDDAKVPSKPFMNSASPSVTQGATSTAAYHDSGFCSLPEHKFRKQTFRIRTKVDFSQYPERMAWQAGTARRNFNKERKREEEDRLRKEQKQHSEEKRREKELAKMLEELDGFQQKLKEEYMVKIDGFRRDREYFRRVKREAEESLNVKDLVDHAERRRYEAEERRRVKEFADQVAREEAAQQRRDASRSERWRKWEEAAAEKEERERAHFRRNAEKFRAQNAEFTQCGGGRGLEKATLRRQAHHRYHPYSSAGSNRARSRSYKHFNNSRISVGNASSKAGVPSQPQSIPLPTPIPTVSPKPVPKPKPVDPLQAKFMRYERLWTRLTSSDTDVVSLGFSNVPWPLLNLPDSPEAITPELIVEFLFHAKRPGYDPAAKKRVVRDELLRWHPDKFSARVLARVTNPAEQIRVSMGGDIVARALTELLTSK